ncbi:hypothetical protein [Butyrivibrio sp. AE2032]|uniref:hypothetical protein n=1 Tax=Butyrivibrio sp. AE2032 TaxID=1458463 RepID=UPI0005533640|nr:hypothetical protein [Butyrivibrio sp. AE2032]
MNQKFFLGGMTPSGFTTALRKVVDDPKYFTYILKGGPGTGKSSLMRKVAEHFSKREKVIEYYCSSDPDSFDAVQLCESKIIIVDGTAPHVFEPKYPGACQKIINLGQFWDESVMAKDREKIIAATDLYKSCAENVRIRNNALGELCAEVYSCAKRFLDKEKVEDSARAFCEKVFSAGTPKEGKESIRQLSAMTRNGYMTMYDTIGLYSKVFLLEDPYFAAADLFISIVVKEATRNGMDVKMSPCLLFGDTVREHLLIEEISTAIISYNPLTHSKYENVSSIRCEDFYNGMEKQAYEQLLRANVSRIEELYEESRQMLLRAKEKHDDLERHYIRAMDFDALGKLGNDLIEEIEKRALGLYIAV